MTDRQSGKAINRFVSLINRAHIPGTASSARSSDGGGNFGTSASSGSFRLPRTQSYQTDNDDDFSLVYNADSAINALAADSTFSRVAIAGRGCTCQVVAPLLLY